MAKQKTTNIVQRFPIVAVMGHVDHGKSSLLDYIRKTNIVASESGGITQHISAYEVEHNGKKITFLDTPGHAAFMSLRARGAQIADIALLIVSAEDGVKPQTLEAYKNIIERKIPFIVVATKIDKPEASVDRVKQTLAEKEIYVEGYGGTVPFVAVSSKTGEGIPGLLDLILLAQEMENHSADTNAPAEGIVLESMIDPKKGIIGNIVIKNGTLKSGMFVVAGNSIAPVRIFENFLGKQIKEATFSSPVRIIGWSSLPPVGEPFISFEKRKDAEEYALAKKTSHSASSTDNNVSKENTRVVPLIIKADTQGSIEAIVQEIKHIQKDLLVLKVVKTGVGQILEDDVKLALANTFSLVIGFNVTVDANARRLAEQNSVSLEIFSIIYKLTEWLEKQAEEKRPRVTEEVESGAAKIQKVFSSKRNSFVIGGKVFAGEIKSDNKLRIKRRDTIIGEATIRELQQNKKRTSSVETDKEFGALIEASIEVVPGDTLQAISFIEK